MGGCKQILKTKGILKALKLFDDENRLNSLQTFRWISRLDLLSRGESDRLELASKWPQVMMFPGKL